MKSQLEQLKDFTTVVADTGDFLQIKQFNPQDSTTNPSLILKAIKMPEYKEILDQAVVENKNMSIAEIMDNALVLFGKRILDIIPGRVSTEVDARLSFDSKATIEKAKSIISLYDKIGIPKEYFDVDGLDEEVKQMIQSTKAVFEDLGVEFVDISLPHTKYGVPAYYVIAPSEISANMSRYDGIRFGAAEKGNDLTEIYTKTRTAGFGAEVQRRIILGTFTLSAGYSDEFYKKAQKVRTLITKDFEEAFETVDAILTPVSPTAAFKIGENSKDPVQMYLEDIFTVCASLAGICGISIPFGKNADNLPVGIQLLGPNLGEAKILQLSHKLYESIRNIKDTLHHINSWHHYDGIVNTIREICEYVHDKYRCESDESGQYNITIYGYQYNIHNISTDNFIKLYNLYCNICNIYKFKLNCKILNSNVLQCYKLRFSCKII